jgi:hypothetical protein
MSPECVYGIKTRLVSSLITIIMLIVLVEAKFEDFKGKNEGLAESRVSGKQGKLQDFQVTR